VKLIMSKLRPVIMIIVLNNIASKRLRSYLAKFQTGRAKTSITWTRPLGRHMTQPFSPLAISLMVCTIRNIHPVTCIIQNHLKPIILVLTYSVTSYRSSMAFFTDWTMQTHAQLTPCLFIMPLYIICLNLAKKASLMCVFDALFSVISGHQN